MRRRRRPGAYAIDSRTENPPLSRFGVPYGDDDEKEKGDSNDGDSDGDVDGDGRVLGI